MTFAYQIRYNRLFKQVIHKVGESEINYIKRLQNAKALEISVQKRYSEDQIMQTFLYNLQQSGKYYVQIASHQSKLRREETFVDQKSLSVPDFQIDYLNLENAVLKNERKKFLDQVAVAVEFFNQLKNDLGNR